MEFAGSWEDGGETVLDVVTWPEEAASWLQQATRFADTGPALCVMAGPPRGWAQMTRRLLWSTSWQPGRIIAFAGFDTERAVGLIGAHNPHGLAGAMADAGTWTVCNGTIRVAPDAALVNYDHDARLGTHQDKDERDDAPVVSLPVGAALVAAAGRTRTSCPRPVTCSSPAAPHGPPTTGSPRSTPRLVGSTGMFTGYAGGLDRKRGLLRIEQENSAGLGQAPASRLF